MKVAHMYRYRPLQAYNLMLNPLAEKRTKQQTKACSIHPKTS